MGLNILFWFICFVISAGVIYVIVQNGDAVFRRLGYKDFVDRTISITPTNQSLLRTSELNSIAPIGQTIHYTGGYDINLYSE
jgi:hypothetical protein